MVYTPWILAMSCTCYPWLSSTIFPNNAKLQRPIIPKHVGVSSSKMGITIISDFCLSDGANPMILVYSIMELQLLKHTSLPPATWTVIFGLPWLPAAKASGLQTCLYHLDTSYTVVTASVATFFGDNLCFKILWQAV